MKNMKGGFMDFYVNQNKWKVISSHSHDDWSKIFPRRGFWLKQPRTTFTESVMIENKKRPKPAPGQYAMKSLIDGIKQKAVSGAKSEKICGFIEESKWQSLVAPGPGHFKNINHRLVEPYN